MKAKDVLKLRGAEIHSIEPHRNIREAIRLLAESDQGALVVMDRHESIMGIITERDILRAHARSFDRMRGFTVSDLMTRELVIGLADDPVECLVATMTEQRIRHLPILAEKKLLGVLSMRDLMAVQSRRDRAEIRHLKDYIGGRYPK
jgi:CBS domain-containing protein